MRLQNVNLPAATLGVLMVFVGLFGFRLSAVANSETLEKAKNSFQNQDFQAAERLFGSIVGSFKEDGQTWFQYGYASYSVGKHEQALDAFKKAFDLEFRPEVSSYNVASMHAMLNNKDQALQWLERALDLGFDNINLLRTDDDWDKYREDEQFRLILARHDRPAVLLPGGDALEFLVGGWVVYNEEGDQIGTNRFEGILGGHAVMEHWEDASGNEGKSMFYFLPSERTWRQVWVTDSGDVKEKSMRKTADGVIFEGSVKTSDGRTYTDRTIWQRDGFGKVIQKIERTEDGGKTWTKTFEASYLRGSTNAANADRQQPSRTMARPVEPNF